MICLRFNWMGFGSGEYPSRILIRSITDLCSTSRLRKLEVTLIGRSKFPDTEAFDMTFRLFLIATLALAPLAARADDPKKPAPAGIAHIKLSGNLDEGPIPESPFG